MKTFSNACAAAMMAAAVATTAAAQDTDADTVLAVVDGTEITLGHVVVAREQVPQQFQELPDDTLFDAILEQLIQQTALADSVDGALSRRDEIALENDRRGRAANRALSAAAEAAVSDAALRDVYEARFADAEPGREFNAAHILVETQEDAEALRAELEEGAEFAALAREHSTDASAEGGGNLGWFGRGMMVEPFEAAVLELEIGEVSDPVETQFGWHLVRLEDTRVADVPEFEAVRDELAAQLQQQAAEELINELTDAADVQLMAEDTDPSLIRNSDLLRE